MDSGYEQGDTMVEQVTVGGKLLAIIVRAGFSEPGVSFFTPDNFSQQLAFIKHVPGRLIEPHIHNPVQREVRTTQEVLVIRKGRLRVDFYDDGHDYLESRILGGGDVILLAEGGHGFEVLEELEMIEVKQGPYAGDEDKTRFAAAAAVRGKR
jgi:mannose-6-phosphate isomerase-like protein (cupin superfamily)